MERAIVNLYRELRSGQLDRREFLGRVARLVGGTAAAAALLSLLKGSPAEARVVPPDDPGSQAGYITYPGATGSWRLYDVYAGLMMTV